MGSGQWAVGSGQWAVGSGQWITVSRRDGCPRRPLPLATITDNDSESHACNHEEGPNAPVPRGAWFQCGLDARCVVGSDGAAGAGGGTVGSGRGDDGHLHVGARGAPNVSCRHREWCRACPIDWESPCLLGKTWGYDDKGVWVSDGCSGEFQLAQAAQAGRRRGGRGAAAARSAQEQPPRARRDVGRVRPGQRASSSGRSSAGELSISGYALVRYVNQMPGEQTFTDHLGNDAHRRWPQRHLAAPGHGLLQGMARQPEADLHGHLLDRARHRPERHLRQPRLPVQPEVQPLRRPQRQPGDPLASGLASVLARPRPRDGRRVLPALLQLRRLGSRASPCPASGTT